MVYFNNKGRQLIAEDEVIIEICKAYFFQVLRESTYPKQIINTEKNGQINKKEHIEGPESVEEIKEICKIMKNNKYPGSDTLTTEMFTYR